MDNLVYELKLFSFLFVGDAVLFANTPEELSMLNGLYVDLYCNMWNLCVNTLKIMNFEKERHTTCHFIYGNVILYIVTRFK